MSRIETFADGVTLYLGDCRDILPTLPKHDALVTDPPYGIGNFVQISGNVRGEAVTWNEVTPPPEFFSMVSEICRHRIIWGANYFNCFEGGALIWIKNQPMPNMSQAEIASVNWGKKVSLINLTWTNYVNNKATDHPCERPVALYQWCIKQIPSLPDTVLDPYMGSGSVGVAAVQMGRKFTGIEISERYFDIACRRIDEALRQPDMLIEREAEPVQIMMDIAK